MMSSEDEHTHPHPLRMILDKAKEEAENRWDPDDYPDDVPDPTDKCICGHKMYMHQPRLCAKCACTYPRKVRENG